jgi:hypothetical protein
MLFNAVPTAQPGRPLRGDGHPREQLPEDRDWTSVSGVDEIAQWTLEWRGTGKKVRKLFAEIPRVNFQLS